MQGQCVEKYPNGGILGCLFASPINVMKNTQMGEIEVVIFHAGSMCGKSTQMGAFYGLFASPINVMKNTQMGEIDGVVLYAASLCENSQIGFFQTRKVPPYGQTRNIPNGMLEGESTKSITQTGLENFPNESIPDGMPIWTIIYPYGMFPYENWFL